MGDAVDNLTAEQVRGAMTTIAQANVFEKDGVKNYVTPQSAAYIERTVSDIFNGVGGVLVLHSVGMMNVSTGAAST